MNAIPDDPFAKPGGPLGQPPAPSPAGWTPGPVTPAGDRFGRPPAPAAPVPALVGLATIATGLFALPLDTGGDAISAVGFAQTRQFVDAFNGRTGDTYFSSLARFWWVWGAFAVGALLVVLLCLAVARVAPVAIGVALAVVAVAGGVVHLLAAGQSADYANAARTFRGYEDASFLDNPGAGVWVAVAGFVLVAVGGVVLVLAGRRR